MSWQLIFACSWGNLDKLNKLIEDDQKLNNESFFSAFRQSMAINESKSFATMLKMGFDLGMSSIKRLNINYVDETDSLNIQTPLTAAIENGHLHIVERLLQHPEIDVNMLVKWGSIFSYPSLDRTPIGLAIRYGKNDILALLLKHPKIDINALQNSLGDTALGVAADYGNFEAVNLILAQPNVNIFATNNKGQTPLQLARIGFNGVTLKEEEYTKIIDELEKKESSLKDLSVTELKPILQPPPQMNNGPQR